MRVSSGDVTDPDVAVTPRTTSAPFGGMVDGVVNVTVAPDCEIVTDGFEITRHTHVADIASTRLAVIDMVRAGSVSVISPSGVTTGATLPVNAARCTRRVGRVTEEPSSDAR